MTANFREHNGIRFHRYSGALESALEFAQFHNHSFLWSYETKYTKDGKDVSSKEYGSSKDFEDLQKYYRSLSESRRLFHEIFPIDRPYSEVYDLDCKVECKESEIESKEKQIIETFLESRAMFFKYLHVPVEIDDFVICSSSNTSKISLHLINQSRSWTQKTHEQMMKLWEKYMVSVGRFVKGSPDLGIGAKNHSLRMFAQTKIGEERFFRRCKWHEASMKASVKAFSATADRKAKEITIIAPEIELKNKWHEYEGLEVEDPEEKINAYLEENDLSDSYELQDCHDQFCTIRRLKPSLCLVDSSKEHDNDNAYAVIAGGRIYLKCRRGCIDPDTNKPNKLIYTSQEYTDLKEAEKKVEKEKKKKLPYSLSIPADRPEIKSDVQINLPNVGNYNQWMDKAKILCVKSQMRTFKTQNIPALFDEFKSILFVTSRVSLAKEFHKHFSHLGASLYLDFKCNKIVAPYLICQIDSIYRVAEQTYDLIILDEITYLRDHLPSSFLQEKAVCYSTFVKLLKSSKKIIAMDAHLDNATIKYLRNHIDKSVYVVENKFASFVGTTARFLSDKIMLQRFILSCVAKGDKIIIPTNKLIFAKHIANHIHKKFPEKKVLLISSDVSKESLVDVIRSSDVPVSDWGKYDVVVYSPKIMMGVSCLDKSFTKTICYFATSSCGAEQCTQMIFRLRENLDNTIYLCVDKKRTYQPDNDKGILNELRQKDICFRKEGFELDEKSEIVVDGYARLYLDSEKRTRSGKNNMEGNIHAILLEMGVRCEEFIFKVDTSVLDKKLEEKKTKLEDIKEEIKKIGRKKDNLEIVEKKREQRELLKREITETKKVIRKTKSTHAFVKETVAINQQTDADIKEAEIHSLFHADILSLKEFKILIENKSRTLDEQLSIDRYLFCETFGKPGEENIEFFKDLWVKKSTFKNLLRVNNTTFAKLLNEQEGRKGMIANSQDRIHQKFTEEKLFIVLTILDGLYGDRIAQFTDPKVTVSKADGIEHVKDDLERYQESLKAYFGIKYNASDANDTIVFRTMNRILKASIGMTMKICGKGKMQLKADGLDVFRDHDVKLVVEKVEDLITPYLTGVVHAEKRKRETGISI